MRSLKLSIAAFMMLSLSTGVALAQSGDEIIGKHISAIGGEKNWSKINSVKLSGVLNMGGMEISTSRTILNNKGMRLDISAAGMDGYIILTQTEGWMFMPFQPGMDKVTPMTPDQVKESKGILNYRHSCLADKSMIASAKYTGIDTIDKAACYKLDVTDKDGINQIAYFDAETYYLVRTEMKGKTQDGTEQLTAVNFGNFQKQPEGIVIALKESSAAFGGDTEYKTVEINKPISDDLFKPSEPKK